LKINLGETAREFRETLGITQRAAAKALEITTVHLCNFEKGKSSPSQALLDRYQELWGIDLYVVSWCRHGDVQKLPRGLRSAAAQLSRAWQERLDSLVAMATKEQVTT
jgi:transcriptional regulator with XRE-family HTH domain